MIYRIRRCPAPVSLAKSLLLTTILPKFYIEIFII